MFEVGKKVVALETHDNGQFKKGDVFELIGIKKNCCNNSPYQLHLDCEISGPYVTTCCRICGKKNPLFECWLLSKYFAPIDNTLSGTTADQLLHELESNCKPSKTTRHALTRAKIHRGIYVPEQDSHIG